MPCFLVPLYEFNKCHNPEGEGGGRFCSDAAPPQPTAQERAHVAPYNVSLAALAQMGDPRGQHLTRRFLFNPSNGRLIVGGAVGLPGREQTHAAAHANAVGDTVPLDRRGQDYDRYAVHGHLTADTPETPQAFRSGPFSIQIDRVVVEVPHSANWRHAAAEREVAEQDALHEFLRYAVAHGATKDTKLYMSETGVRRLGKAYPDLFGQPSRRRKKAA